MTENNPAPKNKAKLKSYTITLTAPRAMAWSIFSVLFVVWIFILGIILGRGYAPEEKIPHLAEIMPKPDQTMNDPLEIVTEEDLVAEDAQKARQLIADADKEYRESLKRAQAKREGEEVSPQPVQEEKKSITLSPKPEGSGEKFDYIYQIASFKDQSQAQRLADKLAKDGIKAKVNQGTGKGQVWNRVIAEMRGTPEETELLKEKLKKHKISSILMLSKKPI